jgi:3-isopropylmalate dehydrogenase
VALLLRWSLNREDAARAIEHAVSRVLAAGLRTADVAGPGEPTVSTGAIAEAVVEAIGSPVTA